LYVIEATTATKHVDTDYCRVKESDDFKQNEEVLKQRADA